MRRRLPWIIALGLVALVAGIIVWPRHDEYAFLRGLQPKESFRDLTISPPPGPTGGDVRITFHYFYFARSYDTVLLAVRRSGAGQVSSYGKPSDYDRTSLFHLTNGKSAVLDTENGKKSCVLVIWDEALPWLEALMQTKHSLRL